MSFPIDTPELKVKQIKTGCLAQYAYMIESEGEIAIIDPLRDIRAYLDFAKERNGKIKWILETHYHADFVSGYFDLSQSSGGEVVFGPNSNPTFPCKVMKHNEAINVGKHKIRCLHTPGHTLESSCYLLEDSSSHPICIFSGDTLFLGDVGRPDLAQKGELTTKDLARYLFNSLKLLKKLPDHVIVFPGHGAGSACGKNISAGDYCIIGNQKKNNKIFAEENEEEFIKVTTSNLPLPPVYFAHDVEMNKAGEIKTVEEIVKDSFLPIPLEEFRSLSQKEGYIVVDCREGIQFTNGHIPGSICCPLSAQFAIWTTYGVDTDKDEKILLVSPEGKEKEAITRLARTGLDTVHGFLEGGYEAWSNSSLPVKTIQVFCFESKEEFEQKTADADFLDVRNLGEWNTTGIIENAKVISLPYVRKAAENTQDKSRKLFVNCKAGGRGLLATSILEKLGFQDVTNVAGGIDQLKSLGVKTVEFDGRPEDKNV